LVLSARLTERIFSQVVVAEAVRQALQVLVVRETGLPQALQEQVMAVAAEADRRCSRQVKTAALLAWLELRL
jgi:predicted phosphoribosyltransferase